MSNYTKTTNFTAKDSLPTGNTNKKINGSLFDTEFDALATAVSSKADTAAPTFTGTVTTPVLSVTTSLALATGATVTAVLDEDAMTSNSATALATQQSIKAYVDAQQDTVDTWAEILALGNSSGATNVIITAGAVLTTDTINETTLGSGVTIDSVLLKDNTVTATTFTGALTGNADTVTTNANLTGHVTSVGNAAVLGSFTKAQLDTAISDGTVAYAGGAFHDGFSDFVANEHIDWTSTSSAFSTTGTLGSGAITATGTSLAAKLGVGIALTEGTLHVHTATAGSVVADTKADDLVVENSDNAGISILNPDASTGRITYGSPTEKEGMIVDWNYSGGAGRIRTNKVGATLLLSADDTVANLTLSGASGSELATFAGNVTISSGNALKQLIGGIGASTTGGTLDWNDASNARSGSGTTLLNGTATNGNGVSALYHSFTFNYANTANMTQWAIGYNTNGRYQRWYYSGSWSSWYSF